MNKIKEILYRYFNEEQLELFAMDEQWMDASWTQEKGYEKPRGKGTFAKSLELTPKGKLYLENSAKKSKELVKKAKGVENIGKARKEINKYLKNHPNIDVFKGMNEIEKYAYYHVNHSRW